MRTVSLIALLCALVATGEADAQVFRGPCHVDTLCAGVNRGGGRIMTCLRGHKGDLSEECFAAIGRSVMNWRGKGHGGQGGQGHENQSGAPDGAAGQNGPAAQGQQPPQ
jgi:hypothetical protein